MRPPPPAATPTPGGKIRARSQGVVSLSPGFSFFAVTGCAEFFLCMFVYGLVGQCAAGSDGGAEMGATGMITVSVRLPAGVVVRLERAAGAGGRAEWIRGVIERALGDGVSGGDAVSEVRAAARVTAVAAQRAGAEAKAAPVDVGGFARADDRVLWEWLRDHPRRTERMLRDDLGWMEVRVSKAVASLLRQGRVVSAGEGVLEAVG